MFPLAAVIYNGDRFWLQRKMDLLIIRVVQRQNGLPGEVVSFCGWGCTRGFRWSFGGMLNCGLRIKVGWKF